MNIFIFHAEEDIEIATTLCQQLDASCHALPPTDWANYELHSGIRPNSVSIFVVSNHSAKLKEGLPVTTYSKFALLVPDAGAYAEEIFAQFDFGEQLISAIDIPTAAIKERLNSIKGAELFSKYEDGPAYSAPAPAPPPASEPQSAPPPASAPSPDIWQDEIIESPFGPAADSDGPYPKADTKPEHEKLSPAKNSVRIIGLRIAPLVIIVVLILVIGLAMYWG